MRFDAYTHTLCNVVLYLCIISSILFPPSHYHWPGGLPLLCLQLSHSNMVLESYLIFFKRSGTLIANLLNSSDSWILHGTVR